MELANPASHVAQDVGHRDDLASAVEHLVDRPPGLALGQGRSALGHQVVDVEHWSQNARARSPRRCGRPVSFRTLRTWPSTTRRRRRLSHPRATRHLDDVAPEAVPGQGAAAREGRRRRRRVAVRRLPRPGPDRARRDAGDGVGRLPLDRRHVRRGQGGLLRRHGPHRGHGHRRRRRRGAVPAPAHHRPLPRRRRRRLRARRRRGVQQLPVGGVHGSRPQPARRHGADPLDRRRRRGRHVAQGQGPRLQGRGHLVLAVGQ